MHASKVVTLKLCLVSAKQSSEVDLKPEAAAEALASPLQEVNDSNLCH
jgi:hypothetical protein